MTPNSAAWDALHHISTAVEGVSNSITSVVLSAKVT